VLCIDFLLPDTFCRIFAYYAIDQYLEVPLFGFVNKETILPFVFLFVNGKRVNYRPGSSYGERKISLFNLSHHNLESSKVILPLKLFADT
jgi:hypothetical protein